MQDLCVTSTRDHNVDTSFRPSTQTKDAETRSEMNSASVRLLFNNLVRMQVVELNYLSPSKLFTSQAVGTIQASDSYKLTVFTPLHPVSS